MSEGGVHRQKGRLGHTGWRQHTAGADGMQIHLTFERETTNAVRFVGTNARRVWRRGDPVGPVTAATGLAQHALGRTAGLDGTRERERRA